MPRAVVRLTSGAKADGIAGNMENRVRSRQAGAASRGAVDTPQDRPAGLVAYETKATSPKVGGDSASGGDPNFMTSLARGLMVVRAFTHCEPSLSIADVARITGLPRAVARRCLYTLMQLGYVGSDGRAYFLRPKILSLGYAYLSSTSLGNALQPYLEKVSEATHESCSVGVLEDDEIVYVARAATKRIMSVDLNVGSRLPAYCSAIGRTLLAHLPENELAGYLARVELAPLTEHTVTSEEALRKSLKAVQQKGYAFVDQELEIGLRSIAVPIRNITGRVVAAMNVSAQAGRVGRKVMEETYLPVLQSAAQEVSALLVR